MEISDNNEEWLGMFRKMHNLKTLDEALTKLIDVHKAWHNIIFDKDKKSDACLMEDMK